MEVKSTKMTSHFTSLLLPGAMRPFFKSLRIIVLPREGGAMRKAEHKRDTKFLASLKPIPKGSFEHRMNTNGKKEDTL